MGMYTEHYFNFDLKQNTPTEIIEILKSLEEKNCLKDKFSCLFQNRSYYTPNTEVCKVTFDKQYSFIGKGDLKNYGGEIEAFFSFINPYIDAFTGEFVGYMRYEEDDKPILFFKQGE